jgi:hypothetical protein
MKEISTLRNRIRKYIDMADEKTLKIVYAMLEAEQEADWWDNLPPGVQRSIDKALEESRKGKGIPHEEVVKKYRKWFTR